MDERKVQIIGMTMTEAEILECINAPRALSCTQFNAVQRLVMAESDFKSVTEE